MITLNNISLHRGTKLLFKNVNLAVFSGNHIGVVGINGSGKSSLFSLLLKEIEPEYGEINFKTGLKIGYLAQDMPNSCFSAIEYAMEGDVEISRLLKQLNEAEKNDDHKLIAEIYSKLYETNGFALKSKAAKILVGLGFEDAIHCKKVNEFSGGWKMRLNLAKVLMSNCDLLLLDEPTNHLDLDAIIWLEKWLKSFEGMLLVVSHDREFLDKIVHKIWHFDYQTITSYSGNYSFFELQYSQQIEQQQAAQKKQQAKIDHMMEFINRFKAKATKAKQAQSRIKALNKLEKTVVLHSRSPINFEFKECGKISAPLVNFEDVSFGYEEDNLLLNKIKFSIAPGERIGLLGKNGMGKTTLVKIIADKLNAKTGNITRNSKLKIGYFAQHQMEQLVSDDSPLQHFFNLDSKANEKELRTFLGSFNFSKDTVNLPIKNFSGGEKARLVLAMLVFQKPNLLLLDEPTNHLDLEMRESLSLALQSFSGALLIVAHDRYLLRTVADELWLINNKKVTTFDGDLDDYARYLISDGSQKKDKIDKKDNKYNKQLKAENTNNNLKKIEKLLAELYKQKKDIETENKIKNLEEEWLRESENKN